MALLLLLATVLACAADAQSVAARATGAARVDGVLAAVAARAVPSVADAT